MLCNRVELYRTWLSSPLAMTHMLPCLFYVWYDINYHTTVVRISHLKCGKKYKIQCVTCHLQLYTTGPCIATVTWRRCKTSSQWDCSLHWKLLHQHLGDLAVILNCRKLSNIRRNKSQNLNDCHIPLQLSLSNQLKPGVQSRMKMYLEQRRQAMLQLHLSDQQVSFPAKVRLILEIWWYSFSWIKDRYLKHLLWHCPHVNVIWPYWW